MPETTTLVAEHQSLSVPASVKELVEALIFAAREPLTLDQLRSILTEHAQDETVRALKGNEIETIISVLNDEFQHANRPYRILRIAGGYQFATTAEYAEWIGKLQREQARRKLSQSALETLAIIAYRQPITRPDIESIRGVDCDYVLGTLLEKRLVTIVGRAPTPGRPLLYGTTEHFLKHFGLNSLTDLPRPREIEELLADSRYETERRMLEAQEQAAKAKKEQEEFKSRLPHIPKKKPEMDDSATILPKQQSRTLTISKSDDSKGTYEGAPTEEPSAVPPETQTNEQPQGKHEEKEGGELHSSGQEQPESEASRASFDQVEPLLDLPLKLLSLTTQEVSPANNVRDEESEATIIKEDLDGSASQTGVEEFRPIEDTASGDEEISVELIMAEKMDNPNEEAVQSVDDEKAPEGQIAVERGSQQIENTPAFTDVKETPGGGLEDDESSQSADTGAAESLPQPLQHTPPSFDSQPVETMVSESRIEATPPPFDATSAAVAPPAHAPIDDEVRGPAQPKSRWKLFKEKIQGFLKKVFG